MKKLAVSMVLISAIVLVACDDNEPVIPGDVEVRTQTSGSSLDPDGYTFILDVSEQHAIGINAVVVLEQVEPGQHSVELSGLARNCAVVSDNPVDFEVWGGTSKVFFDVRCDAAGALRVTANTSGSDIDANGYGVAVDGVLLVAVRANESVTIGGLGAGPHEVELRSIAGNCTVAGENPRNVNVAMDEISVTRFDVTCAAALLDHIAFTSERDGNQEIYVVDQLGSDPRNLTNNPAADFGPAVSPDGTKIAFTTDRDGDRELYVMNHDGTGLVRLTNSAAADEEPAWSPDGSQIAFVSERDGNPEIYVIDADGTGLTRLTRQDRQDRWPAWSPDGDRVAFASWRDGNWEIYVMDADGNGQTNLTQNRANDRTPDWSPDGALIAFVSDRDGNSEIYSMGTDGTGLQKLTDEAGADLTPAWSPDRTRIAFGTDRDGDLEIYVLNLLTSGLTKLTGNEQPDYHPSWSPQHLAAQQLE